MEITILPFFHKLEFLGSYMGWDEMITNEEEMSLYKNIIATISIV